MWEITDNVYLGDRDDARDRSRLSRRGVTHVLNCAAEERCHFPESFRYLHLAMQDPDERFAGLIAPSCAFVDDGVRTGGVLVHCSAGVSRSAAVVLAWLCCRGGHDLAAGARRLAGRVLTNPDPLFLRQLARHLRADGDAPSPDRVADILLGRTT